jgi:hypothetical protein
MMSQAEVIRKAPKCSGSVHWVQIFPLQVLNQRQLSRLAIVDQLHDGWDFGPAKLIHSAPTALAGDQFKPPRRARKRPNHHWLHQSRLLNTACECVERHWIHAATGLVLARLDSSNSDECDHSVGQL